MKSAQTLRAEAYPLLIHLWLYAKIRDVDDRETRISYNNKLVDKGKPSLIATYQANIVYQKLRQVLYLVVIYVSLLLGMHNVLNGALIAGMVLGIFSLFILLTFVRQVTINLDNLKAVVNAALVDEKIHFRG